MTSSTGLRLTAIRQVAQPTTDLARAVAFYRDRLGARLIASFDPPGIAFSTSAACA